MFLTRLSVLKTLILVIPPTIVLGLLLVALSPVDLFFRSIIFKGSRLGPVGILIKKIWMSWILKCHGIKITKSGLSSHELKKMKGIVFAANHQSLLDIPAILSTISPHSAFLAKDELKWIPIFGWAAWIAGTEFIDRRAGARVLRAGDRSARDPRPARGAEATADQRGRGRGDQPVFVGGGRGRRADLAPDLGAPRGGGGEGARGSGGGSMSVDLEALFFSFQGAP
jgi:hypothetical protein